MSGNPEFEKELKEKYGITPDMIKCSRCGADSIICEHCGEATCKEECK